MNKILSIYPTDSFASKQFPRHLGYLPPDHFRCLLNYLRLAFFRASTLDHIMKFIQFAYLAIVAAVSLGAAVMPIAGAPGDHSLDQARSPPSEIVQRWCRRPGQGCYRFKRSDIHDFSKWEPEPVSMKPLPGPKKQMEVDEESRKFFHTVPFSRQGGRNGLSTKLLLLSTRWEMPAFWSRLL